MTYPGDGSLDPKVQQRVLTAFAEAVRLYREGHNEEALTILRSITDVDPRFSPAQRLESAIAAGAPVDLTKLLGEVGAPSEADVAVTLVKARQAMAGRDFPGALALAQSVLKEMPGQAEARQVALEAQAKLRAGGEIRSLLQQAAQALDAGVTEEARNILRLAKAKDAGDPAVVAFEARLQASAGASPEAQPEFEFEVFDNLAGTGGFEDKPLPPSEDLSFSAEMPVARTVAAPGQPAAAPVSAGREAGLTARPAVPAPARPPGGAPAPPRGAAPDVFAAPEPEAPAGGFAFDDAGSPAVTFGQTAGAPVPAPSGREDAGAKAQELLEQGQAAFDRGDYQTAIDTWSRIYLIDAHHSEAELRIEQARRRREEVDRQVEHLFYEARDAADSGRLDEARKLCQEVLSRQPQHLEAHDLLARLETPAAPPPPPAPAVADEDDLFRDDFVPATISSGTVPAVRGGVQGGARETEAPAAAAGVRLPRLSPLVIGIVAGVVVLAAAATFVLRGKVFSGGGSAVTEAMAEAEKLVRDDRLQDALQVLQSIQAQADGEQAKEISRRQLDYQRRLKAKAAKARVVDLTPIRAAISEGRRIKALRLIEEGLTKAPGDSGLEATRAEVLGYSAALPSLMAGLRTNNWDSVMRAAAAIREQYPEDPEAKRVWAAATFNAAIVLARRYSVTEAYGLLNELAKVAPDPEVERLQQGTKTYLTRSVDPRYEIFVRNIELRSVE